MSSPILVESTTTTSSFLYSTPFRRHLHCHHHHHHQHQHHHQQQNHHHHNHHHHHHHSTTGSAPVRLSSFSSSNLRNLIFFFFCFLLLLSSSLVDSFQCVHDGCDCRFLSGKNFAVCVGINLTKLPPCNGLTNSQKDALQDIQAINLTQNYFPELTANFFSDACMHNLQRIFLQQVGLKHVNDQAFYPLKNIVELSLSTNSIRNVPTKAIESLTNLRILDLSFNKIDHISNNSFREFVNLKVLMLNNNELSFIDTDAFNGLVTIEKIFLNSNSLKTLQPEVFSHLRALHSLYLESNLWECNCRMQPFKRMLLQKSQLKVHDSPRCITNDVVWGELALENFQCAPRILRNFSDSEVTVSEGSVLRLKCAIFIETFGSTAVDEQYLAYSNINWYWKDVPITNNSRGCDRRCKQQSSSAPGDNSNNNNNSQQLFTVEEYFREYNSQLKIKISHLVLYSVLTMNEGSYTCNATNSAGADEWSYQVHVVPLSSSYNHHHSNGKIIPAASSDSQVYPKRGDRVAGGRQGVAITGGDLNENNDHILFGLVLGILCGIFIVLVIFSVVLVVFFRRHHHPKVVQSPVQELVTVDGGSTDDGTAGTLDENQDANTETTEKMTLSAAEFNPLLVVNPVQKPPRLGIPDVSSIYSQPSWTMDRANAYNRSRYASYAETEPLYSDYYTLYRPNRHGVNSRLDNRTFISDTASEV